MSDAKFVDLPVHWWRNHDFEDTDARENITLRIAADNADDIYVERPDRDGGYLSINEADLLEAIRQSRELNKPASA